MWTKRFTVIAGALAIPGEAIIDGEVAVVYEGRTNFSELQAELATGRAGRPRSTDRIFRKQRARIMPCEWVRALGGPPVLAGGPFSS